eukprot:7359712-Karenia_brevis.AAC.1
MSQSKRARGSGSDDPSMTATTSSSSAVPPDTTMTSGSSVGDKRKRDDDDDYLMDGVFELELSQLEHEYEQLLHSMGEDTKASLVE